MMAVVIEGKTKRNGFKVSLWPIELNLVYQLGDWESQDEILSDALEALLEKRPQLRLEVALQLYQRDYVSLNRATEIAGTDRGTFMGLMRERGVEYINEPDTSEDIDTMLAAMQ